MSRPPAAGRRPSRWRGPLGLSWPGWAGVLLLLAALVARGLAAPLLAVAILTSTAIALFVLGVFANARLRKHRRDEESDWPAAF